MEGQWSIIKKQIVNFHRLSLICIQIHDGALIIPSSRKHDVCSSNKSENMAGTIVMCGFLSPKYNYVARGFSVRLTDLFTLCTDAYKKY